MDLFYIVVLTFFIIRSIVLILTWWKLKRSGSTSVLQLENSQKIWFVLPALNEVKIAEETVSYYYELLKPYSDECELVIITSPEASEYSTYSCIQRLQEVYPITLKHDRVSQSKQEKLNRIYREIKANSSHPFWIFVFDFDARPSTTLIERTIAETRTGQGIEMIQAIPVTTAKPGMGWFSSLSALDHLYRVLFVESFLNHFKCKYYLRLGMGACLLIKSSALDRTGGFPKYSDDIELGYRLDLLAVRRKTIMEYPTMTPVNTFGAYLKQYSKIMLGVLSLKRVFNDMPNSNAYTATTKLVTYSTNFFSLFIFLLTVIFSVMKMNGF
ncbi:glycosyltransferase [Erwinia oleae]|uniref:glycosyltransferase n=1 Tax=Erwinia oleae TaxID=796334 RepID=UPI00054E41CE|nr:glycosyltransferase family 2 protein [Erwinia oleae]